MCALLNETLSVDKNESNGSESYFLERDVNVTSLSDGALSKAYVNFYKGVAEDIFFYGMCIVGPFGLMGNLLSVCVFLRSPSLRKTTTGQWLVALAIADSTVLIGEIIRWLSFRRVHINRGFFYYFPPSLGLNFFDTTSAGCKITHFLRYSGSLSSAWITVAIAVERLIAVAWPLKIVDISTPRRVHILIALIAFGSLALGLFPFWTVDRVFEKNGPRCRISNPSAYNLWNDIVIKVCSLVIPCVLITVLTMAIISLLYRARKRRKTCLSASIKSRQQSTAVRLISMETQMTIMLVAVCVSTAALRAPYTIAYYIRSNIWYTRRSSETEITSYFASRSTDLINVINYAVNFILYCLCGSSFRKECAKLLWCCSKRHDQVIRKTTMDEISVPMNSNRN